MKKVAFVFLTIIVTYILLECGSFVVLNQTEKLNDDWLIPLDQKKLSSSISYRQSRKPEDPIFFYARHPYFGFVPNYSIKKKTFVPRSDSPQKTPLLLRIGIFGGSVAEQFGDYLRAVQRNNLIIRKIKDTIPCLEDSQIEFLTLGVLSSKQPQTFSIASHFIHDYDVALVIDGINDATHHSYPQHELSYPNFSQTLFSAKEEYSLGIAKFVIMSDIHKTVFKSVAYQYSYTLYLIYSIFNLYIEKLANEATASLEKEGKQEKNGDNFYQSEMSDVDIAKKLTKIYFKFSQMQHLLSESFGKLHLVFLQPIPSWHKPLTDEESSFLDDNHRDWGTVKAYKYLLNNVNEKKVDYIHDLTQVFSKHKETLYVDGCCHVNAQGNQVLFEAILKKLKNYSDKICQMSNIKM